jgi:hypothetical protein
VRGVCRVRVGGRERARRPGTGGRRRDVDARGCAGEREARAAECTWFRNEDAALAATAGGLGTEVASLRRRVRETEAARGAEASEGRDDLLARWGEFHMVRYRDSLAWKYRRFPGGKVKAPGRVMLVVPLLNSSIYFRL